MGSTIGRRIDGGAAAPLVHSVGGVGKSAVIAAFSTETRAPGATVLPLDGGTIEPTDVGSLERLRLAGRQEASWDGSVRKRC